jgi:hypothetical protein
VRLELLPLTGDYDYPKRLAAGEVDLVIGNWLKPPGELHLGRLISDEIVCLVGDGYPSRGRWTAERYLAAEHVAPMPFHAQSPGVVDDHLASLGLARNVVVRSAHFGLIPTMVAQTMLVLTTGRLFCSRYVDTLPVRILRCPIPVSGAQLLPALARRHARVGAGEVAARAGARGGAQPCRPRHADAPRRMSGAPARLRASPCMATCSTSRRRRAWGEVESGGGALAAPTTGC